VNSACVMRHTVEAPVGRSQSPRRTAFTIGAGRSGRRVARSAASVAGTCPLPGNTPSRGSHIGRRGYRSGPGRGSVAGPADLLGRQETPLLGHARASAAWNDGDHFIQAEILTLIEPFAAISTSRLEIEVEDLVGCIR